MTSLENGTVTRETALDTGLTNAENSYSTTATTKWSTFANALAAAEKAYLQGVAGNNTNALTTRNAARSVALKDFQIGLLDAGVTLNGSSTGAIQTYVTGQAGAEATEAQGEAGAAQANAVSATAADTGLTSALVSAGNAAALALSGSAGVFSTAVSGAQRAWKIAAATANGDHNTDQAVAKYSVKMAEWWADQGQSDPVSTAAGIVNTLVTAIAGAESTAATTMGNALTTAVTTIGTADVAGVTTVTNADKTYSTASVGNDKTYLDGMATGEADYLKVVANKWHEFRTGAISAAERDSAISAKWTEFQAAAITKRNTFRVDQATDAATFRNAVVGAEKTHVDAVTTAAETLNDGLQNAQKTLATSKWNAWLTASKGLVNRDAESTIAKAESLADAIGELATATGNRVSGSSGSGSVGTSAPNPFWTALAAKADQSAEYIADTKNAERLYYGRSPWSETGANGAIIDYSFGTRGVLDARRDYEVGMADATATQNKALQHTAGTRDRELAAAAVQLAQSRGAYEISWANLSMESSGWHLDQSALPITGADDGTISVTPNAGTNFVPGWFSVPRLSEAGSSFSSSSSPQTTSTGFSATDLDQYFTAGLMPDMPGTDPVSTGKASRDDSRFTSALMQPAAQDGNQTQPPTTSGTAATGDGNPGYEPPQTSTNREPIHIFGPGELTVVDGKLVEIPPKRTVPAPIDGTVPMEPIALFDPIVSGSERDYQNRIDAILKDFGQHNVEPSAAPVVIEVYVMESTPESRYRDHLYDPLSQIFYSGHLDYRLSVAHDVMTHATEFPIGAVFGAAAETQRIRASQRIPTLDVLLRRIVDEGVVFLDLGGDLIREGSADLAEWMRYQLAANDAGVIVSYYAGGLAGGLETGGALVGTVIDVPDWPRFYYGFGYDIGYWGESYRLKHGNWTTAPAVIYYLSGGVHVHEAISGEDFISTDALSEDDRFQRGRMGMWIVGGNLLLVAKGVPIVMQTIRGEAVIVQIIEGVGGKTMVSEIALGPWLNTESFWVAIVEKRRVAHLASPGFAGSNALRDSLAIGQYVFFGLTEVPLQELAPYVKLRTNRFLTQTPTLRLIHFDATNIAGTAKTFRTGSWGYFARAEAEMILANPELWSMTRVYINGRPLWMAHPRYWLRSGRRAFLLQELQK